MSVSASMLRKLLHSLVVMCLLTGWIAPAAPVVAQAVPQPIKTTTKIEPTEMKYGSLWSNQSLTSATQTPLLSEQLAAQPKLQFEEGLSLQVSMTPEIYVPGKPVQLFWQIQGDVKSSQMLEVAIKASPKITPIDAAVAAEVADNGEIRLSAEKGYQGIQWTVAADAERPFSFSLELLENGQVIDEQVVVLGEAKLRVEKGRTKKLDSLGGKVHLDIPMDALSQSLVFDIRTPSPHRTPSITPSGHPIEVIAADQATGQNVTRFKKPITLKIQYSEDQIFDWREENLQIFYYSETDEDWMPMATVVDPVTNTLTTQTDHLTVFDYKASTWQKYSLPTVDNFQVSNFTGAGTYSLQLWTPPGTAGLQPDISMHYSSQVIDEANAYTQASWVGMGWTLDTPSITRNTHETEKKTVTGQEEKDDTFTLSINGMSHTLLPVAGKLAILGGTGDAEFVTTDGSYDKIIELAEDSWVVYGKDGSIYRFDSDHRQRVSFNGCANDPTDYSNDMRWMLSSVTDKYGNRMEYTYYKELKKAQATSTNCIDEVAIYPETITYANGHYRVRFVRDSARRGDFQTSWLSTAAMALYGTYRLKNVLIEQYPEGSSTWQTIRQYELSYADGGNGQIFPNFTWTNSTTGRAKKTLTLLGIQEMDATANLRQPAVTFSYGDSMHLTEVNNGQGGKVQISYVPQINEFQASPQTLMDNVNPKARAQYNKFTIDECASGATLTWSAVSGIVRCEGSIHYLQVGNLNASGKARHSIPEHIVKLGGHYRAYIFINTFANASPNTTVNFGFYNSSPVATNYLTKSGTVYNQTYKVNQELVFSPDWNISTSWLRIECLTQGAWIMDAQISLMPYFYRATTRTIVDEVAGTSTVYTYRYDNPATNNVDTSAAVVAANAVTPPSGTPSYTQPHKDYSYSLYRYPNREYRGNAMTEVVAPNKLATLDWYYQTDALKGQSYRTITMREDMFDDMDRLVTDTGVGGDWTPTPAGAHSIPTMQALYDAAQSASKPLVDYDRMIQSVNNNGTWAVSLERNSFNLVDGQAALAHFRLTGANSQGEAGLVSGSGKFFGVTITGTTSLQANLSYDTGSGQQTGATLIPSGSFLRDKWYAVLLFVDKDNGFRVKLWQLDKPENGGEATISGYGAENWKFRERVYNGTLALDAYREGSVFSESETIYGTQTLRDNDTTTITIPGFSYPDLSNFKDLYVIRTYPLESIQRTYDGHSSWYGVKQVFAYDTADQNGAQYGNLTKTIYSEWKDNAWVEHHATRSEYWPRNSITYSNHATAGTYLVGLPARETTVDCAGGCNFTNTTGLLAETLYFYDHNADHSAAPSAGALTRQRTRVDKDSSPAKYRQADYAYDHGNPSGTTVYAEYYTGSALPDSSKRTTTTEYDSYYRVYPVRETNPLGQETTTGYDYAAAQPSSVTDANGNTTAAAYDGLGRMTEIRAPGDESGAPTLAVSYANYAAATPFHVLLSQKLDDTRTMQTVRYYSGTGKLVQSQTLNASVEGQSTNIVTSSVYDSLGRAWKQTRPYTYLGAPAYQPELPADIAVTETEYDILSRVTSVVEPNGNRVTTSYDGLRVSQVEPNGHQLGSNPIHYRTTTTSDVWGQVTSVTPPSGPVLRYEYDVLGRLVRVTKGSGENSTTTAITYDFAGRKIGMTDPDMGDWNYAYDALGNLTTQSDARGCETRLAYDALGRLTGKSYGGPGACEETAPVQYSYDGAEFSFLDAPYGGGSNVLGQRTGMVDGSGATLWEYDARGRKLKETKRILAGEDTSEDFETTWTYNSADLPVTTTYPDGETIALEYNDQGQPRGMSGGEGFAYVRDTNYDEAGRVTAMQLGEAGGQPVLTRAYEYFPWTEPVTGGRLERLLTSGDLQDLRYSYDANGNILSIANKPDNETKKETSAYTYDALNRLTGVTINEAAAEAFAYDGLGRMSGKGITPEDLTAFTYDAAHPHAVAQFGDGSYGYDANGNQIERVKGDVDQSLTYDAENRLVAVDANRPTPTETATPTATATQTETPTVTATPTLTATQTNTPTTTATQTGTASVTPTHTATQTATQTDTPTVTATATTAQTPTYTPTPTQTATATVTATPTQTATVTHTPTLTLTPTRTNTPPGGVDNLIPNGDFEEGLSYWNQITASNIVTDDYQSGSHAVRFTSTVEARSQPIDVVPGETYTLTFWYKWSAYQGNQWGCDRIWITNSDWSTIVTGACIHSYAPQNTWTMFTLPFTPATEQIYLTFGQFGPQDQVDFYFDNFILQGARPQRTANQMMVPFGDAAPEYDLVPAAPEEQFDLDGWPLNRFDMEAQALAEINLIPNGDFEDGLTAWNQITASNIVTDDYQSGSYSVRFTSAVEARSQPISVVAGETYTLTFWYKWNQYQGNQWGCDRIWIANGDWSTILTGTCIHNYAPQNTWTMLTLPFTPASSQIYLTFGQFGPQDQVDFYFDNLVLTGPVPDGQTATPTPTATLTPTPTATATSTLTATPATGTPAFTPMVTFTPTSTQTATATATATVTGMHTPTPTWTPTPTQTATQTATATATETATPTPTPTASPTPGSGSVSARYWYDGDGTLVKSNVDGVVTYYAGRHYHKVINGEEETLRKFYTAGSAQVAVRTNGVLTWVLSDHLGSASVTADESGVELNETRYTAFGEVREGLSSLGTGYEYTGQLSQMDEIGLYYYVARWYDPVTAHFGSADSIIPEAGKAAAFDRYAYSSNNPINYTDPTGHWPEWFDWLQGAAYQYANDVTLGAVDQVAYALGVCMDCNVSEAYEQGQQAGRGAAIVQASAEEVVGAATLGAALAGVGPTGGVSLAAAPVTGGTSLVVGGVTIAGEVVVAAGGAVVAVHGVAVTAFTANNPLGGNSQPSIDDLLNNPNSFAGKTQSEIEALIPSTWEKSPLTKGDGIRYLNPDKPGQALYFEQGWSNARDPLHAGPYLKISNGTGKPIRIPLAGNPLIGK